MINIDVTNKDLEMLKKVYDTICTSLVTNTESDKATVQEFRFWLDKVDAWSKLKTQEDFSTPD